MTSAMRFIAWFCFVSSLLTSIARAQEDALCAFDYVIVDGLIAKEFAEVTGKLSEKPDLAELARRALPSTKRVFVEQGGYIALVGWEKLPEDYSKFSELQVREQFRATAEYNKHAINPNAEATYRFSETKPFAFFFTLEQSEGNVLYRDFSMDLVARPWCILSVKLSGPVMQEDAEIWTLFSEELDRIRAVVAVEEKPVTFSEQGVRFSWYGVLNTIIYLGISLSVATLAFAVLSWWFRIELCKEAWRYSATIVILSIVNIGITVLTNESFRGIPTKLTYESVLVSVTVLAVHLAVLVVRSATVVRGAISLMIGLFATRALYTATGWLPAPAQQELIGIAMGVLLLTYVLSGTLRRRQAMAAIQKSDAGSEAVTIPPLR